MIEKNISILFRQVQLFSFAIIMLSAVYFPGAAPIALSVYIIVTSLLIVFGMKKFVTNDGFSGIARSILLAFGATFLFIYEAIGASQLFSDPIVADFQTVFLTSVQIGYVVFAFSFVPLVFCAGLGNNNLQYINLKKIGFEREFDLGNLFAWFWVLALSVLVFVPVIFDLA